MLGPHGVRGEVRLELASDAPERFTAGAVLECDGVGPLTIVSVRPGPRAVIVRFAGYDSHEAAASLRGRSLRVSRDEARRAAGDRYLWADLLGLEVLDPEARPLGTVREVLRAGETDVLVIARPGAPDLLVPALASVVRSVDLAGGRIVVAPQEELER